MADVRALLKAKREEKRVSHPFAAYSQSGQLRCTACSTNVKHASAWNGHLGSKSHRTNAARVKEEERLREALEDEKRQGKRKAVDEEDHVVDEATKKRRVDDHDQDQQRAALPDNSASGFPSDFFSDPTRTIAVGETESDEEEGDKDNPQPPLIVPPTQIGIDLEWAKFQEAVINAPPDSETDVRETFERATIFAEPQLSTEVPEGFPSSVVPEANGEPELEPAMVQRNEGEERRRKDEEEKELIMDRLLDEERAQEEADGRVSFLKARLDLLKQKRMAAKASKPRK